MLSEMERSMGPMVTPSIPSTLTISSMFWTLLRFNDRDARQCLIGLMKIFIRIKPVYPGAAWTVTADTLWRVTARLPQDSALLARVDERTQNALRTQVEVAADFIGIEAQRPAKYHRLSMGRGSQH